MGIIDTKTFSENVSAARGNADARKQIAFIGIKGLPSTAGADRVVEAIVRTLDKQRYNPVVYCSAKIVPKGTIIRGVELIRIRALPGAHLHPTSLFLFAALHAILFRRFDLVHLHNLEASYVLPILRIRYPVITTSHGPTQNRIDKWGKIAMKIFLVTEWLSMTLSNAVTSVSEPQLKYFKEHYRQPVYCIPNGVDVAPNINRVKAQEILDAIGVSPNNFILFSGRIMPTKGCHVLLDAFLSIDTEMNLLIVGDRSILPEYAQSLIDRADERVHFVDFISDKPTLLGLVQTCRIFVHPSTVEAMSMMLLEAATMKAPIICSDIPENTHVIRENALVFPAENVLALAERLEWALAHPKDMKALGEKGYLWVCDNYAWDDIVHCYEELYEKCMKGVFSSTHVTSDTA